MSTGLDGLQTPWLRQQLIQHLRHLADLAGTEAALASEDGLDELLDFFDDSGAVDRTEGRIGSMLRDASEAEALARLGASLDEAITAGRDPIAWRAVGSAARAALDRLNAVRGHEPEADET